LNQRTPEEERPACLLAKTWLGAEPGSDKDRAVAPTAREPDQCTSFIGVPGAGRRVFRAPNRIKPAQYPPPDSEGGGKIPVQRSAAG